VTVSELAGCAAAFLGFAALWITRERREDRRRDFRRTGLNTTLLASVMMAGAAWGQDVTIREIMRDSSRLNIVRIGENGGETRPVMGPEWRPPQPGPLCGQKLSTPETNSVSVACVDFDAIAKLGVPGVYGQRLQVLIQAKYGEAVRVRAFYVNAEGKEAYTTEWADITRNQAGELVALVQFMGWQYSRVEVRVLRG
jgi:hypothetical protein